MQGLRRSLHPSLMDTAPVPVCRLGQHQRWASVSGTHTHTYAQRAPRQPDTQTTWQTTAFSHTHIKTNSLHLNISKPSPVLADQDQSPLWKQMCPHFLDSQAQSHTFTDPRVPAQPVKPANTRAQAPWPSKQVSSYSPASPTWSLLASRCVCYTLVSQVSPQSWIPWILAQLLSPPVPRPWVL